MAQDFNAFYNALAQKESDGRTQSRQTQSDRVLHLSYDQVSR